MIFLEIGISHYNCPYCEVEINGDKTETYKFQRWGKTKRCPECGMVYGESVDYKGNLVAFKLD